MMLPVMVACTSSMCPSLSAAKPMMSSAAFPKEALRKPPSVGPVCFDNSSVASPISPASGTMAMAPATKTQNEPGAAT